MDADQASAIEERACTSKTPYGDATAHAVADQMRSRGEQVTAYRCLFCHRWHVGHVPSMESVATLAAVIRYRSNGVE